MQMVTKGGMNRYLLETPLYVLYVCMYGSNSS